ncbi:MAG: VWA domain-containing protein [Acidimicrobiales bacterium]|nr:VWA domain-containing protein [Acidimicrobiales bacterium]
MSGAGPTTAPERLAVGFARVLRGAGLDVPVGSVLTFVEALGAVGVTRRDAVYWAGRTTLVRRPEDVDLYERAFAAFWEGAPGAGPPAPPEVQRIALLLDAEDEPAGGGEQPDDGGEPPDATLVVRFSGHEVLRHKDFAACSRSELEEAQRLMADLRLAGALRRSRRLRPSRRLRGRPDVRRTVRGALRAGGEPVRRAHLEPDRRPRRLVLLLDVSGSMEPYARALLRFVHAAVVGRTRVEAFTLGTRLTRITRQLASRDPDLALASAGRAVADWSGGTRLGEGLRAFNDQWGVRGTARGAVVVVLSDGWDRGAPEVLAEQMQRLRRVAHRVVWVNPLKATPGYAPLARGMAAALPYVDEFVEGHSVASLEQLAEVIAR